VAGIEWITYAQGGVPVEMNDERDWAREIHRQRVRPDTLVTVYRTGEPPRTLPAADVAELSSIFARFDPPPPPPPLPPPPAPAPPTSTNDPAQPPAGVPKTSKRNKRAAPAPVASTAANPIFAAPPPSPFEATRPAEAHHPAYLGAPFQPPPPPPRMNVKPLWVVLGITVFLLLVIAGSERGRVANNSSAAYYGPVSTEPLPDTNSALTMGNGSATIPDPEEAIGNLSSDAMGNMSAEMGNMSGNEMAGNMAYATTTNALAPTPAGASSPRTFHLINRCQLNLRVWVEWQDSSGGWSKRGPVYLSPGGSVDMRTANPNFYFYAEAPEAELRWGTSPSSLQPAVAQRNKNDVFWHHIGCPAGLEVTDGG